MKTKDKLKEDKKEDKKIILWEVNSSRKQYED